MERVFLSESSSCITAVYRLGNRYVNWYLVDSTEGLLVIDTGLAGHSTCREPKNRPQRWHRAKMKRQCASR